jgi:hypothetical protein
MAKKRIKGYFVDHELTNNGFRGHKNFEWKYFSNRRNQLK